MASEKRQIPQKWRFFFFSGGCVPHCLTCGSLRLLSIPKMLDTEWVHVD